MTNDMFYQTNTQGFCPYRAFASTQSYQTQGVAIGLRAPLPLWGVLAAAQSYNKQAEYGKQIVATVSRQLQNIYGHKGFEGRTARRMMQFAQQFPNWEIVSQLATKLSWSHFVQQIQKSLEVAKAKWGNEIKEDEE